MKRLLTVLILLLPYLGSGQAIDSLQRIVATTRSDTSRVMALVNLTTALQAEGRLLESETSARQALSLSQRIGFPAGEHTAQMRLAATLEQKGQLQEALQLGRLALAGFRRLGLRRQVALAQNTLGNLHFSAGAIDSARYHYQASIRQFRQLNDRSVIASPLMNLGQILRHNGQLAEAVALYQEAHAAAQSANRLDLRVSALQGLGLTHNANLHDDLAIPYYQQAIRLLDSCRCNPRLLSSIAYNAALSYHSLNQRDSTFRLARRALWLARPIEYRPIVAYSASKLGLLYLEDQQLDSARIYLEEAQQAAQVLQWPEVIAGVQYNLGRYHLQMGNALKARQLVLQGLAFDTSAHNLDGQRIGYQLLYQADSALGNFRSAFVHLKKWYQCVDSLRSMSKTRELAQLEAQFQARQQIESLNARRRAERERTNWLVGSATVIVALLLGLAFLLFRGRRKEHRANTALRQLNAEILNQKAEIEAQNAEIVAQRDQLEALDRFKDELTGMIVHDLKNPLNAVLGLSALPPTADRLRTIRQAGQQMSQLVLNLLDIQKYESNELHLVLAWWPSSDLIAQALAQVDFLAESKGITFDVDGLEPELHVLVDAELIVRVWVNLLTNAIKYAPAGDRLIIEARPAPPSGAILRLTDHGQGIPPDQLERIFDKFSQLEGGKPSGRLRSSGLGLTFCRLTVEAHGGSIAAQSQPGQFTTFSFYLPHARMDSACDSPPLPEQPTKTFVNSIPPEVRDRFPHLIDELRQIPIYNVSLLIERLAQLPDEPELVAWKSALEQAAFAADADLYHQLLS